MSIKRYIRSQGDYIGPPSHPPEIKPVGSSTAPCGIFCVEPHKPPKTFKDLDNPNIPQQWERVMAVSVVWVDSESPWIELGALKLISDFLIWGRVIHHSSLKIGVPLRNLVFSSRKGTKLVWKPVWGPWHYHRWIPDQLGGNPPSVFLAIHN